MMKTETHKTHPARRAVLAAAVSMLGLAATAQAQAPQTQLIDLKVIDRETGETARVWRHAGRLYVAGNPGARYSLRVTNNTGGRVLAVMSVDGVNILTGETAGYGQRGYVLSPYETYDVNGWRKSDTEVAAFNFAPLSRSYAAQTGRPTDVGVIGVAAFRERVIAPRPVAPVVVEESRRREAADSVARIQAPSMSIRGVPPPPAPAPEGRAAPEREAAAQASANMAAAKLGTGHGAREWSTVSSVSFTRASPTPQYIYRVEYDSRERLMASGVIPRPRPTPPRPRPFPSSPDNYGYVPDPPRGG